MKTGTIITICASAACFKEALDAERELKKLGFRVQLPHTALKMKQSGDFRIETYKTWFKDPKNYKRKRWLIANHMKKVISGDAILVVNGKKNAVHGYIGGNTLMEMAIAFHYKKPIYILHQISDQLSYTEEVLGLSPVFLGGSVGNLSL